MPPWVQAQARQDKVSVDEFVGITLKNVVMHTAELTHAKEKGIAVDEHITSLEILIDQAERTCIAGGYIVTSRKKADFENLDEVEKEFLEAARKYFAVKVVKSEVSGMQVENKARGILREIIEGPYAARLREFKDELDAEIMDKKELEKNRSWRVSNYRYQLMLEGVTAQKAKRKEMDV